MSHKLINEVGNRYGRLTVVSRYGKSSGGAKWECTCDCGSPVTASGTELRRGKVESCGCLKVWQDKVKQLDSEILLVTINGENLTMKQAAKLVGLSYYSVWYRRHRYGQNFEDWPKP